MQKSCNKYEVIRDKIIELNNLRLYIYEQNRKIKNLKYLHIEHVENPIEINDEFITKYDIKNKYIELINSNYDCSNWPADPYFKAFLHAFNYDATNINHVDESVQKIYVFCNHYEMEKRKKLIQLLGKDANEINYIKLLNDKLDNYYKELDDSYSYGMIFDYTINYY